MARKSKQEEESEFLYHTSCINEECDSSDGLGVFSDGHGFCFACESTFTSKKMETEGITDIKKNEEYTHKKPKKDINFLQGYIKEVKVRGLTKTTCDKFNYQILNRKLDSDYMGRSVQIAPYYDLEGNLIMQKLRYPDKDFIIIGDLKPNYPFFGMNLWKKKYALKLVITEGEIDCMSVAQLWEYKYPVVSIPNGAKAAKKCIKANLENIEKYKEIILMFDNDEAGREAAKECAALLPIGKCKIARLPLKDANEMLLADRGDEVIEAIYSADVYRPDGIITGEAIWDYITKHTTEGTPYPFTDKLNELTGGMRTPELILLTAGTGAGKSLLAREIADFVSRMIYETQEGDINVPVGYIALEEGVGRTALNFIGFELNKPLHIDKSQVTEEQLRGGFVKVFKERSIYLYDHFGTLDTEILFNKIRYLVKGCDCRFIFLDHISILVSGSEDKDERKMIDLLMTDMRSLIEELQITMVAICHLTRSDGKAHEEGGRVSLKQLRGSGSLAQLSDTIIAVERDQQDEVNKDISHLRVLKCRITGDTGSAGWVHYNKETGRLTECEEPLVEGETSKDFKKHFGTNEYNAYEEGDY